MRRRVPVANDAFEHGEVDHDPAANRAWITRRAGSRSRRKVDPSYPAAEAHPLVVMTALLTTRAEGQNRAQALALHRCNYAAASDGESQSSENRAQPGTAIASRKATSHLQQAVTDRVAGGRKDAQGAVRRSAMRVPAARQFTSCATSRHGSARAAAYHSRSVGSARRLSR